MDFYRFPPHATDDLFLELAVPETSYRHSPRGVRAENKFALEGRIVIGSDSHHENNNEKKKKGVTTSSAALAKRIQGC